MPMEEVINNQQLDQQPLEATGTVEDNQRRRRLVYGVAALLAALLLLGGFVAYRYLRRPKVLTEQSAPPRLSRETPVAPAPETGSTKSEQPSAPATTEESLDQELDDLEKDLGTLDQIDSELNSPNVDLNLGL
jgi:hypothetical protein